MKWDRMRFMRNRFNCSWGPTPTRARCGARRLAIGTRLVARAAGALAFLAVVLLLAGAGLRSTIEHVAGMAAQPASAEAIVPDRVIQLFNGRDLSGWQPDVPSRDKNPDAPDSFIVRNGMLVSLGLPRGHLLTESAYRDYRLEVEYRFPGKPGNCGVLVHASRLRALSAMFPNQSRCR